MKRFFVELLTLVFLLVSCANSQTQTRPDRKQSAETAAHVTLCQILSKPDDYLGRLVTVKVRIRAYRHGTSISDSSCPSTALYVIAGDAARKNDVVQSFFQFVAKHRTSTAPIDATLTGRTVRGGEEAFVLKREFVFDLKSVSEFAEAGQNIQ